MDQQSPEEQLEGFIERYNPEVAEQGRVALARMRELLPGAVAMVYDNYNALVVGFSPTPRPSDAIFSIALFPRWVTLCFLKGAGLADPHDLLQGEGKLVRHISLRDGVTLDSEVVLDLIERACAAAVPPFDDDPPGPLVIRSVSVKQRPRRPT